MPIVDIKGVGKAQFPDNMPQEDIRSFLRQKYPSQQALQSRVSLEPKPQTIAPVEQTLVDKAEQTVSDFLFDNGIISDRGQAQRIGGNIATIGEFLPGVGDATAGDEFGRAAREGDKLGMAMAGLGVIPIAGDVAKKGGKILSEVADDALYKVHNVTTGGLEKAGEFGGIPVPSIAIAGKGSGFDSFGDISLIGTKDAFKKDPTFAADVYSPRTPKPIYNIDSKAARDEAMRVSGDVDPRIDSGFDSQFSPDRLSDDLTRLEDSRGNKVSFLKGIGQDVNPDKFTSKPKKYDKPAWFSDAGFTDNSKAIFRSFDEPEFKNSADAFMNKLDPDKKVDDWWDGQELSREGQKTVLKSVRDVQQKGREAAAGPQFDRLKAANEIDKRIKKNQGSFDSYIKDQRERVSKGKAFTKFNPDTGNTKKFDYNLENAVKLMKGNIRGGEGFNYGVGNIRAQATPQLKSLSQIQNRRGQIVGEDQMTMVKEGFDSRLDNLYDDLKDNWAYGSEPSMSDFSEGITQAAKGDMADFKGLSSSQKAEMQGFFDELANAPTNYFEVKPQRAVDVSEFYGAAVPYGTPKSVVDGLKAKGLKVERYKPEERMGAIEKLNRKSGGNVFFSGAGAAMLYGASRGGSDEENNYE